MPGFTVTRGLGPGATPTNLIARGFLPVEVERVLRGGRSELSRLYKDLKESFIISAKLLNVNGKLIPTQIFNSVSQDFLLETNFKVDAKAKTTKSRPAKDITVTAAHTKRKLLK